MTDFDNSLTESPSDRGQRMQELYDELYRLYRYDENSDTSEPEIQQNPLEPKLGPMIANARIRKGLSRTQLAKITGISQNSLAKYEKAGDDDGQYPPIPKLAAICQELSLDPREMLQASVPFEYIREDDGELVMPYFEFKDFLRTLDTDETEIARLHSLIRWANESIRELQKWNSQAHAKNFRLERENRKLKGEINRMKISLQQKNDPNHEGSGHSEKSTSEPEVVEATSSNQPKETEG